MSTSNERLAVLIDADNTSPKHIGALLDELVSYGVATVKRAYGDWTTPQLNGWKSVLNQHAIVPVQQFAYTTGKNSTDSTLIIDAMDLLYSGNLDAFALVSSDSDFTRLATRLRESGKTVYGLGLRKTPASLVAACDRFIYLEVLGQRLGSRVGRRPDQRGSTGPEPAEPADQGDHQRVPGRRHRQHQRPRQLPALGEHVVRPAALRPPQAVRAGAGAAVPDRDRQRERDAGQPEVADAREEDGRQEISREASIEGQDDRDHEEASCEEVRLRPASRTARTRSAGPAGRGRSRG